MFLKIHILAYSLSWAYQVYKSVGIMDEPQDIYLDENYMGDGSSLKVTFGTLV